MKHFQEWLKSLPPPPSPAPRRFLRSFATEGAKVEQQPFEEAFGPESIINIFIWYLQQQVSILRTKMVYVEGPEHITAKQFDHR